MPPGKFRDEYDELEFERSQRRRSKAKKTEVERDTIRPRPTRDAKRPRKRDWMDYLDDDITEEELVIMNGRSPRRPADTYSDL